MSCNKINNIFQKLKISKNILIIKNIINATLSKKQNFSSQFKFQKIIVKIRKIIIIDIVANIITIIIKADPSRDTIIIYN